MLLLLACLLVTGCAPSDQYLLGQGFYSADLTQLHVQDESNAGRVTHLGKFSDTTGGCFMFSRETADQELILPVIKDKLKQLHGNVADNVLAADGGAVNFLIAFLILPGLAGCSHWNVSGEILRVEHSALGADGLRPVALPTQ